MPTNSDVRQKVGQSPPYSVLAFCSISKNLPPCLGEKRRYYSIMAGAIQPAGRFA